MNIGMLIALVWTLIMGFFIGVLIESKSLLKWFIKELDIIEERYKRKYGEDGDENEQEKED